MSSAVREGALTPLRVALHLALFALTLITTAVSGLQIQRNFAQRMPLGEPDWQLFLESLRQPSLLSAGLPFAGALLGILLAHEFGHYCACRYYRVPATLPYFLPAPTLIGTFGAFIRIPAPIYWRHALFDIGIAGPLAGMAVALPVLAIGLCWSIAVPGSSQHATWEFGLPLLLRAAQDWLFPGTPVRDVLWHPVAYAGWVGLFATGLNLLPIGQLDGGHLLYAVAGKRHRALSIAFALLLALIGVRWYWPWVVWSAVLLLFGLRHPVLHDQTPLGRGRTVLAILAALLFVLCFMPAPLNTVRG